MCHVNVHGDIYNGPLPRNCELQMELVDKVRLRGDPLPGLLLRVHEHDAAAAGEQLPAAARHGALQITRGVLKT